MNLVSSIAAEITALTLQMSNGLLHGVYFELHAFHPLIYIKIVVKGMYLELHRDSHS